jgi:hypothetical protein
MIPSPPKSSYGNARAPAVDYTYANGDHGAHQIGLADWPLLLRLESAGKLIFQAMICVAGIGR